MSGVDWHSAQPAGHLQLAGFNVNGIDRARAKGLRQLNCRSAQSAYAKHGDRFAGFQARLVQSVERCGRGAHHDGRLFEGNFLRKREQAARRDDDELGVAAITMFANHRAGGAELLAPLPAIGTFAAGHQVVDADPIALLEAGDLRADMFNAAGDLMSERQRQWIHARFARSIMGIGVADARCLDAHQHFSGAKRRDCDLLQIQGTARLSQSYGFHAQRAVHLNPLLTSLKKSRVEYLQLVTDFTSGLSAITKRQRFCCHSRGPRDILAPLKPEVEESYMKMRGHENPEAIGTSKTDLVTHAACARAQLRGGDQR